MKNYASLNRKFKSKQAGDELHTGAVNKDNGAGITPFPETKEATPYLKAKGVKLVRTSRNPQSH